ncbi:signal peptide protein, YSIRK family, partial [Gemella haemolysans]
MIKKQHKININQRDNRFSIRKFNVGVASIAVSSVAIAGVMFLGNTNLAYAGEGDSGFNRTGTGDSTVVDAQEFVMVTHEKPGGVVEDVAILKSKFSESLDQLKKDYPGFTATNLQLVGKNKYKITYVPVTTTNKPSSTTESVATNQTQPTVENRVSLQGNLVGKQTEYNVGEQIISTFRLDVSAPSKLEDGSYILVNLPANEPITDVQLGTALKVEKVNDTQYKIYTGEVPSGSYASFNISYKFDKYRTGRNSQTTITAQVVDKTGTAITPTTSTTARVTNTNKSGYASIYVDSESGARDLALFNTNAPGDSIDETKNKELVLKLTTFNKETSAVNKIVHEVTLPTGAVLSQASINDGWTQEGTIARYTRTITDAKPMFDQGNNTSDDTLRINMRQAGTLEEFLKGKEFTFTDNVIYTDKSGETNTSQGTTSLVVKAVNPYENNGGGATPNAAGAQPPLVINNFTNEQNHENRVNIAIPGINTETDDKRIIVFWRSVNTPTKVKEVELTIDSDFNQKRSLEFYGIWNKNGAYAAWYAPDDLGTSNTFEVYTVNGATETKLGEISFKKNGGTSIDLPEGTTKVVLKPKGEMNFTSNTLSQAGIYLHQNLKGLEKAKQMVAEGKEAKSIVTAKVSTQDTDVVNTSISKTILADARTALKLEPRTGKVETVLAGNKTQALSSGIEAYNYSPSGLGNRVYSTYTSHGATTDKSLTYLGAKNAKIIVELPDGFSYAGNSPLVTKDDNYQNTGKRVLIIDPKDSNTRENVTPDLEFNVAQWVQTGSYRLKYTLVWDENRFLHGLNPNNEFDGDKTIINTSTFTYEIPVSNTSGTRLHVDVTDKNDQREGYTTSLQNLAPKTDVTYRFTLSNTDNSKLSNNEVLVTLPKKGDKNIVDTNIARNSAFDVEATGEAIAPAGWTAYYLTSPINGNANEVAAATTLTADQVTDWSKVTAVKFVSNQGTTLNPGLSNEFLVPARISKDAKDKQVAYISAAAKTNAEEIYNEANVASVTIKVENIKNGAVKIAYEDMQGNTIKPTITAIEKRAYTKDYNVDTEEYRPDEFTYNDIAYRYMRVKENSAPVEGVINSEEITVTYVYDTLYENVPETKTITRTIKYVDANDETKEVSPKVVQTVTLTRTNKRNKVTNTLEEGTWTQGSWEKQVSPTPANYGTPDKESVSLVEVTPTMEDTEVVVKYPQAKEDEVETKVITRTIKYVDASNETTEVSPKVVQTV